VFESFTLGSQQSPALYVTHVRFLHLDINYNFILGFSTEAVVVLLEIRKIELIPHSG